MMPFDVEVYRPVGEPLVGHQDQGTIVVFENRAQDFGVDFLRNVRRLGHIDR
jgi:hypothetical protein